MRPQVLLACRVPSVNRLAGACCTWPGETLVCMARRVPGLYGLTGYTHTHTHTHTHIHIHTYRRFTIATAPTRTNVPRGVACRHGLGLAVCRWTALLSLGTLLAHAIARTCLRVHAAMHCGSGAARTRSTARQAAGGVPTARPASNGRATHPPSTPPQPTPPNQTQTKGRKTHTHTHAHAHTHVRTHTCAHTNGCARTRTAIPRPASVARSLHSHGRRRTQAPSRHAISPRSG